MNHEQIPDYGPNRPLETGVRWGQYPRGFQLRDTSNNRLFSGAPPLNPLTNLPYLGAVLSAPRGTVVTAARCGMIMDVSVADPFGGFDFRRCIVGPGSPVALALGQYAQVTVTVFNRSAADGALMNTQPNIQWVDQLPSLPDTGLLRSPVEDTGLAGTENNVPDGAVEVFLRDAAIITFRDYSRAGGGAPDLITVTVVAGATIRTQGQTLASSVANNLTRFFLAGL